MSNSPFRKISTADLSINISTQQVFKKKQLINLTDLTYQVLMALIKASPDVVSSEDLIDQVWQDIEVSPETVTQRIAMLRKALSSEGEANDKYIKSIRNKGYRWVPEASVKATGFSMQHKTMLFGVVLFMLVALYYWGVFRQPQNTATSTPISGQANVKDLTQQAWYYLNKHEPKSNVLAIGLFRKSLAVNPNHLNALTGLSIALSHQVTKFNQPDELLIEAQKAAELAVEIDPKHAQAWAALAFVYDARGELYEAVIRYEKALALNPDDSSTASSLAYLYGQQGRLVDALKLNVKLLGSRQLYLDLQIAHVLEILGFDAVAEQWYARADELSPDNVFATHLRARYYLSRNQYQRSQDVVDDAMNRGVQRPELPLIKGILAWIQKDTKTALASFEQAVVIDAADGEANVLLFLLQHPEGVSDVLKQNFIEKWFMPPYSWPDLWVYQALFYAHFGDQDRAVKNLEQAYLAGYRNHHWLKQLPPFQALHANVTWTNLLEAMQNDVSKQRQQILQADWLPTSFLDPQN